jgi:hypothetical protein
MKPTAYDSTGNEKISLNIVSADTDWIDGGSTVFSGTTSNPTKGTVARDKVWWRRQGDSMEVRVEYQHTSAGSVGSGNYLLAIPSGYSIDTTKVSTNPVTATNSTDNAGKAVVGHGSISNNSFLLICEIEVWNATQVVFPAMATDGSSINQHIWGSPSNGSFNSTNLRASFSFKVPILGWSTTDATLATGTPAPKEEIEAELANGKYITPDKAQFIPGVAKAWVTFNTVSSTTISGSYNVSSITDNGTGDTTINFSVPFANTTYCLVGNSTRNGATGDAGLVTNWDNSTNLTTSCRVVAMQANTRILTDFDYVSVVFFGEQ